MSLDFAKRGNYIEENPQLFVQGLFEESSTQKQALGTRRRLSDGREFIYCKLGAANSVAGQVYAGAVVDAANHANLALGTAGTIGDKVIANVTLGNTLIANTANNLAEGFAHINVGAGNGHVYKIKSHALIAANGTGTFYLYDKLRANLATANSKITLMLHPCKGILQANATATAGIVGVAPGIYTANYFCWMQTKGPAALEVEGAGTLGASVYVSTANGTVTIGANGTSEAKYCLGTFMCNNANDHWALVWLNL